MPKSKVDKARDYFRRYVVNTALTEEAFINHWINAYEEGQRAPLKEPDVQMWPHNLKSGDAPEEAGKQVGSGVKKRTRKQVVGD